MYAFEIIYSTYNSCVDNIFSLLERETYLFIIQLYFTTTAFVLLFVLPERIPNRNFI